MTSNEKQARIDRAAERAFEAGGKVIDAMVAEHDAIEAEQAEADAKAAIAAVTEEEAAEAAVAFNDRLMGFGR
jgi:hypothetical protein